MLKNVCTLVHIFLKQSRFYEERNHVIWSSQTVKIVCSYCCREGKSVWTGLWIESDCILAENIGDTCGGVFLQLWDGELLLGDAVRGIVVRGKEVDVAWNVIV